MKRTIWVISVGFCLSLAGVANAQGTLQRARDNSRPGSSSDGSASPSTGMGNAVGNMVNGFFATNDPDWDLAAGAGLTGLAVLAPFIGPIIALGDNYECSWYFAPYPYAGPYRGYHIRPTDARGRAGRRRP